MATRTDQSGESSSDVFEAPDRFVSYLYTNIVKSIYNTFIRDYLPRKVGTMNGVAVRNFRLLDQNISVPEYEAPAVSGLRDAVRSDDHVVVVGGGRGVTSVVAARQTNGDGDVSVFEASKEMVQFTRETLTINDVRDRVSVQHSQVGPSKDVWGENPETPSVIEPNELPPADVLELDCEGAEMEILTNLESHPREIIVEYHEQFGIRRKTVENELRSQGYTVEFLGMDSEKDGSGVLHGKKQ